MIMTNYECKDCGFKADSGKGFITHVHECKVNPIPLPSAEVERLREVKNAGKG
jgi:hypothetical protein